MTKKTEKQIKVKLVKSTNGRLQSHKDCVRGLGLRRMNSTATVIDTPANRGMINQVCYLLQVEEV
jgi:large subunit ribosomal protein L30